MKIKVIALSLLFVNLIFSQDKQDKLLSKGNWFVTNQFGSATIEATGNFKLSTSIFEGMLGREIYLNDSFSLISGLEFLRVRSDFIDLDNKQQFLSNNYLNFPVSFKFYKDRYNKIALFGEIGLYGAYLYDSKIENVLQDETQNQKKLGFNFGQHFVAGLRFKLDERYGVSLGFKYKADFASSYKNSKQEFKLTEYYAIQLGLSFEP